MITPELDEAHVTNTNVDAFKRSLQRQLTALLRETTPNARFPITIDLQPFTSINDTGLAALIRARRQAEAENRAIIQFSGINRRVQKKITMMGFEAMFGLTSPHERKSRPRRLTAK